jgi:hypothetical protein
LRLRHALLTLALALLASLPGTVDHAADPQPVASASRLDPAGSGPASSAAPRADRRGGIQFAWLSGASHARWDPCAGPITYRVNPRHLPRRGLGDIERAFAQISAASGLSFSYVGRTSFVPHRKGQNPLANPPGDADAHIAWTTPRIAPSLRAAAGYGGAAWGGRNSALRNGTVVLDITDDMGRTAKQRHTNRMTLLLHEFGHLVGLTHVKDPRQIMHPGTYPRRARYAAGDLRGLAAVGAGHGCVTNG